MGRILLVEPERILQLAIILALFPEHEVRVEEGSDPSKPPSIEDWDLVIIDWAALEERGGLSPEIYKSIARSDIPALWLEAEGASRAPKRERLLAVKKPIQREEFLSALSALLSPSGRRGKEEVSVVRSAKGAKRPKERLNKKPRRNAVLPAPSPIDLVEATEGEFIDLVDVVEEK